MISKYFDINIMICRSRLSHNTRMCQRETFLGQSDFAFRICILLKQKITQ